MQSTPNPVIASVIRGGAVESQHRGAFFVSDAAGRRIASAGDVDTPVFPRSAIKAFQFLAAMEAGVLDAAGFTSEEIALAVSSHNGEAEHLRVARAMLVKARASEADLECGAHWPLQEAARLAAARSLDRPLPVHNCCSGKHAGMLALARQLGAPLANYTDQHHPVQQAVAAVLGRLCDADITAVPTGIDGCSVPSWALPLRQLALGFARLPAAAPAIISAVRAHPFMVAGTGRFDTRIMQAVPRLFIKLGAEGVFCGSIPHAGLGFALKCDDGAYRGAEAGIAKVLSDLTVWTADEAAALQTFTHEDQKNWRKTVTGEVRARGTM